MSNDLVETTAIEVPARATQIGMTISPDSASLVPQNLGEVVGFAQLMSRAGPAVPKHLRGEPGACLAVAMRAFHLGMEPFALADKSYFVNDRMAFEAQAIAAIILARVGRKGMPRYSYSGDEMTRRCHIEITMPDGEVIPWDSPELGKISPRNSPLWKSDPDQQLGYYSIRGWARRHRPDAIMGIYDRDEAAAMDDGDKATSFDALEARAAAAPAIEAPKEEPKPDPQPAKAAAARAKKAEPASPASEPTTATDAGTQATGGDTGPEEGDRPQETAGAQSASDGPAMRDSVTSASGSSAEETSSQEQPIGPSAAGEKDDDVFPGDRAPSGSAYFLDGDEYTNGRRPTYKDGQPFSTATVHAERDGSVKIYKAHALPTAETAQDAQEQVAERQGDGEADQPPADAPAPASGGFVDFAEEVASAKDWPTIQHAMLTLRRTPEWAAAEFDQQEGARRIAYHRLQELVSGGYEFDLTTELQAWRAYLSWETDLKALYAQREKVSVGAQWKELTTEAKIVLDKAFDARVQALKASQEYA